MSEGMKVGTAWVLWVFLAIGTLGWSGLIVLDYVGVLKDAPAWVQAVGSIGAILAAVAIAKWDGVQQAREKNREKYEYMQKSFGVAAYAEAAIYSAAQYILSDTPTEKMLRYHIKLLEMALEDLRGIDQTRLDDLIVADAFMSIKRNVYLTCSTIQLQLDGGEGFTLDQVAKWGPYSAEQVDRMSDAMILYLSRHPRLVDDITVPLIKRYRAPVS